MSTTRNTASGTERPPLAGRRIAVLGAGGQAGRRLCRLFAERWGAELLLCGRPSERLERVAAQLPGEVIPIDVRDQQALDKLAGSVELLVGATSRWQHAERIAEACVRGGCHALSLYLSQHRKWQRLRALHSAARDVGVCIVDDAGSHPGMPGALIRWAAPRYDLSAAWVAAWFGLEWGQTELAFETAQDFLEEIRTMEAGLRIDGAWRKGYRHARDFGFETPGRELGCIPAGLEEIRELGPSPSSAGFFIAGFGPAVDYGIMPASALLGRLSPTRGARLLLWGLRRWASGQSGAELLLEGRNRDGRTLRWRISCGDAYDLTAWSAAVAGRQVLAHPRPGVWTQAAFVDPAAWLEGMERLGARLVSEAA